VSNMALNSNKYRFSDTDISELKLLLNLDDSSLPKVVRRIETALYFFGLYHSARQEISDVREARNRIERIAATASRLRQYLKQCPDHPAQLLTIKWAPLNSGEFYFDWREMPRMEAKLRNFLRTLDTIVHTASIWADNEDALRRAHRLVRAEDALKSVEAAGLWPNLFKTWEDSGRQVAKTAHGPLHRFVSLVHRVAGLPEPKASTLKDAVTSYKRKRHRAD
jgi:hypothetical protein